MMAVSLMRLNLRSLLKTLACHATPTHVMIAGACSTTRLVATPLHSQIITRSLSASRSTKGLMEFFPPGAENLEDPIIDVTAGRAWLARDLRNKSNVDLHKLWYVLLKERNMLLTWKQEAKVNQRRMPAPDRLKKVRKSMQALKVVLAERQQALEMAQASDPECWQKIRADAPTVNTGIRPQIGSEKGGRIARAKPKPTVSQQQLAKDPNLVGVMPPNYPLPGQTPRMMTKAERRVFRKKLRARRESIVASRQAKIVEEIKSLSNEDLLHIVDAAEDDLIAGWELEDLSFRHLIALEEAKERGMDTIYQAKSDQ